MEFHNFGTCLGGRDDGAWQLYSKEAMSLYRQMLDARAEPNSFTIMRVHKACPSFGRLHDGKTRTWLHSHRTEQNTLDDVTGTLRRKKVSVRAGGCSSGGGTSVYGENDVDSRPSQRNEYSWTVLISQYTKSGQGRRALRTYQQMRNDGVQPSSYTFVALLKACSTLRDLESTRQIHAEMVRCGFAADIYVGTMVVDVYAKCGSLVDARSAFENMPYRDVVSWNTMILAYAQMKKGEEALQLYTRMQQEGFLPDERTYVSVLKACNSLAGYEERAESDGTHVKERCLKTVRAIHNSIRKRKFDSALFVGNMLVDVYAKCGGLADARHVFENMLDRDVVSWNTMILGYAQMGKGEEALELYVQMKHDGVAADQRTYVSTLKACSSLALAEGIEGEGSPVKRKSLEIVRAIHARARKGQFELDVYVGTMLVDVYAKCGSLEDARHVFEKMPHRTVVTWNAIILGYAQMEQGEEALRLFARMQKEGIVPDDRTCVSALKACSGLADSEERNEGDGITLKERCLDTVRSIHADIVKWKFESDVFVGTMLVDVYAKCGRLVDARDVFERMPRRTVVSWNAIILGYAHMGEGEKALQLYNQMQEENVIPNDRTYVSALKACSSLTELKEWSEGECTPSPLEERCLETVRAIHTDLIKRKLEYDVFVGTMLVDVYAKCGSLEDAMCVFEKMPHRDVVSWTAIISGYTHRSKGEEALKLFARMRLEGVVPNDRTYVSALKACSSLADFKQKNIGDGLFVGEGCLETVRAIHADVVKGKFESDVFVGTMLVDVYVKCGSLEDALCVFKKMPQRDVVSWTALILGYAQMGKSEDALQLFAQMQMEGVVPNDRTYVGALKACSCMAESRELNECDSNDVRKRCLDTVKSIHAKVVEENLELDVFVGNMLVDVYAKCGSLEDARSVFEKMPIRDVVSWNAMILSYAQMEEGEVALHMFTRMEQDGLVPNDRTYVGVLKACATLAGLDKGKEIHAQILRAGLEDMSVFLANGLIDMYGKCGSMSDAQQVFDALPRRDIVAWSALIAGYAQQGESETVFELLQRMEDSGMQPNGVTFLSVLTACSHAGLVERGQKYFEAMIRDYGINPTIKHFTCMIDLLGRSGQVDKAMELVRSIPFQPDSAVWECVLGACRKWKNVELGRQAFESAVRLDKNNAAAYVTMSNICADAHMEQEAKEIQALRLKSRAWKQPGRSQWTDMTGTAHVFVVGDQGHPDSQDIYANLGDLLLKMKKEEYVPNHECVLWDIADEGHDALCRRSGKLAVAYTVLQGQHSVQ